MKTKEEVLKFNLVRLRGDRTQQQAADLIGIPFPSYRSYENGKIPQEANLTKIAAFYGIPVTALFADPDLLRPNLADAVKVISEVFQKLPPATFQLLESIAAIEDKRLRENIFMLLQTTVDSARKAHLPLNPDPTDGAGKGKRPR